MDDLIRELRKAGVGCHMGGVLFGVVGYGYDFCQMALSRYAM